MLVHASPECTSACNAVHSPPASAAACDRPCIHCCSHSISVCLHVKATPAADLLCPSSRHALDCRPWTPNLKARTCSRSQQRAEGYQQLQSRPTGPIGESCALPVIKRSTVHTVHVHDRACHRVAIHIFVRTSAALPCKLSRTATLCGHIPRNRGFVTAESRRRVA